MLCAAMEPRLQLKRSSPPAGLEREPVDLQASSLLTELPGFLAAFEGSLIQIHSVKVKA